MQRMAVSSEPLSFVVFIYLNKLYCMISFWSWIGSHTNFAHAGCMQLEFAAKTNINLGLHIHNLTFYKKMLFYIFPSWKRKILRIIQVLVSLCRFEAAFHPLILICVWNKSEISHINFIVPNFLLIICLTVWVIVWWVMQAMYLISTTLFWVLFQFS